MIKVAIFAIIASLITIQIKSIRSEISIVIMIIASIMLSMYGLTKMKEILSVFETIKSYTKIPKSYYEIILKLIGISFVCEFTSNICKDAGSTSIAKQIEWIGKLSILIVGLPVLQSLFQMIQNLLGNGV